MILAFAGLVSTAPPAHAGSNGQHLLVHDPRHITASISIYGQIWNGTYPHPICVNIPNDPAWVDNNWWKGEIDVKAYGGWNCSGTYYGTFYFNVPKSYSSDWYPIYLNYP
jgi:hypothetical protein